jgi:hypothetical protein
MSPVRTKHDVVVLWMNAIKAFLANQPASTEQAEAWLSIAVKSMSRLFFGLSTGRRMFSVSFPFTVRKVEGELLFFSREGILVDSQASSQILGLLDTGALAATDFWGFVDPVLEAVEADADMWTLLRELLLAEDAYVRYDWDEERADGHLHPVHHLDLGYSNGGTFKLGLQGSIDHARLVEILDVDVDCDYVLPVAALSAARART